MDLFWYIMIATLLGSIGSLAGALLLFSWTKNLSKISHILVAFAAGVLLATAFLDLLPEAFDAGFGTDIFGWVLIGILFFFLLERFVNWFHHRHLHPDTDSKPIVPLIILGDTVHNFIDGIAIAAAFLINIPLGIVTTVAVAAHEIPQEIGDFGLLLKEGLSKKRVIIINVLSSLSALLGALLAFLLGQQIEQVTHIFLALTAGFFIYIALSDLIPEIHHERREHFAIVETSFLFLGIVVTWLLLTYLERMFS